MGQVRSLNYNKTKQIKLLKQKATKKGYVHVSLCKGKYKFTRNVHRLVAEAFIPNPNNYPIVNHKEEERKDFNCTTNLEWCTQKYNINYGKRNEKVSNKLKGRTNKRAKETLSKIVYQYSTNGEFIKRWDSTMECERNGYLHSKISLCCRKERKTHKGYIWSYTKLEKEGA